MKEARETTKSYTVKDFYTHYMSNISDNFLYDIDYTSYRAIVTEYFKFIRDEIIEHGRTLKLPCRLGHLYIIKHKPKTWTSDSLCIDYKLSKEYDKPIYHLNEHTGGFKYRFLWSKNDAIFINKSKYHLTMTRANKRRLAQILKNRERDYIER